MKKLFITIAAWFLFILGTLSMFSPIPGATLFFAFSLTLLISVSPYMQFCVQWIRSRVAWINSSLHWLEKKTGTRIKMIGETLKKTHPLPGTETEKFSHKEYIKKKLKAESSEESQEENHDKSN